MRDVARAHIQGALDDIRDGYVPEAIAGLYHAANDLKAYLHNTPNSMFGPKSRDQWAVEPVPMLSCPKY